VSDVDTVDENYFAILTAQDITITKHPSLQPLWSYLRICCNNETDATTDV